MSGVAFEKKSRMKASFSRGSDDAISSVGFFVFEAHFSPHSELGVRMTSPSSGFCFAESGECSRKRLAKRERYFIVENGAGEGSRTLICSLEGCRSAVELHPH